MIHIKYLLEICEIKINLNGYFSIMKVIGVIITNISYYNTMSHGLPTTVLVYEFVAMTVHYLVAREKIHT